MLKRLLFCINDPSHASYAWAVESRFAHKRTFDPMGNTLYAATTPVADTDPGEVRCAVCGGAVYVAGLPSTPGGTVACDILGRCRAAPADANLARLDALAAGLAANTRPTERARLAPVVATLLAAVGDDPAAAAVLDAHGIKDLYPAG